MRAATMPALNIVIIGAGIAGLTAALALRRQGHHITLLEKSPQHRESGAAVHIGANVSGLLRRLGVPLHGTVKTKAWMRFSDAGDELMKIDLQPLTARWKEEWLLHHRVDLHGELQAAVCDARGPGPVPQVLLGCQIAKIDSAQGTVELDDGRIFHGDLLIGADGNRSFARLTVQPDARLIPYGKVLYRWMTRNDTLMQYPETRRMVENEGHFVEIRGSDRRVVFYPCRGGTVINFGAFIPAEESGAEGVEKSSREVLREAYGDWFDGVHKAIVLAEEDPTAWHLYDMAVMPSWTKDKLVLIGDAAHPFLPFLGQGAAIAIEDAICLGGLFQNGTPTSEVLGRLKLYQSIRYERATYVQWGSRVSGMDEDVMPDDFNVIAVEEKCHDFDEWENSDHMLEEWLQRRADANGA